MNDPDSTATQLNRIFYAVEYMTNLEGQGHPQKAASDRVRPQRGVSCTAPLTCASPRVRGA
jgi:hypothetical protein